MPKGRLDHSELDQSYFMKKMKNESKLVEQKAELRDAKQKLREFESNLDKELKNLSPEARADVERNLGVIRRAIDDISAALEEEPDNEFLQELLVQAYRNELALMNRVGNMTHRVMARKDI